MWGAKKMTQISRHLTLKNQQQATAASNSAFKAFQSFYSYRSHRSRQKSSSSLSASNNKGQLLEGFFFQNETVQLFHCLFASPLRNKYTYILIHASFYFGELGKHLYHYYLYIVIFLP